MFDITTIKIMYENGVVIMNEDSPDEFDGSLTAFVEDMDFSNCTFIQLRQCVVAVVQDDDFKGDFYSNFETMFIRMLLDRLIVLHGCSEETPIVKDMLALFDSDTSKKY